MNTMVKLELRYFLISIFYNNVILFEVYNVDKTPIFQAIIS